MEKKSHQVSGEHLSPQTILQKGVFLPGSKIYLLFNNCTRSNRKDHNSNYRQILLLYEQIGTRWRRLHYFPICPPGGVIRVLALFDITALAFLQWVERTRSWSRSGK